MTNTIIQLDMLDVTAKEDSNLVFNNISTLSSIDTLYEDNADITQVYTLEQNVFCLNDERIIPSRNTSLENTAYISSKLSDENGDFDTPITLTINFDSYHTSAGITINFGIDSYAKKIIAKYYSDTDVILEKTYTPNEKTYWLKENTVEFYNKIELKFTGTNIPYRFLKIEQILYGVIEVFESEKIIEANTSYNINLLSSELEVNTLNFKINDQNNEFNITNKNGFYGNLQSNQLVKVKEIKDNKEYYIGTYYISGWKNEAVAQATFEAQDVIGLLDNYIYNGGYCNNVTVEDIINEIIDVAEIETVVIQEDLKDINLYGYMPISTCREALQQVLFVIGAVCDTSSYNLLKIYKTQKNNVVDYIEDNNKLYDTTQVEMNNQISGIAISMYSYAEDTEISEIAKGNLDGINKIEFSSPYSINTIYGTNCTIIEKGNNYAVINSSLDTEFILYGKELIENEIVKNVSRVTKENLPTNLLEIKENKLINQNNFTDILTRVFDFYNGTYKTKVKVLASGEITGNYASVNTFNDARLLGNITNISCNLARWLY